MSFTERKQKIQELTDTILDENNCTGYYLEDVKAMGAYKAVIHYQLMEKEKALKNKNDWFTISPHEIAEKCGFQKHHAVLYHLRKMEEDNIILVRREAGFPNKYKLNPPDKWITKNDKKQKRR